MLSSAPDSSLGHSSSGAALSASGASAARQEGRRARSAKILPFPERTLRPRNENAAARTNGHGAAFESGVSGDGTLALEGPLAPGIDEAELLEFLAADLDPVPADPVFREKLRDELWSMVAAGSAASDDDPGSH